MLYFTAIGGCFILSLGYYFLGVTDEQGESRELFKVVNAKNFKKGQEMIRRRKVIVTAEEMKRIDPTFILPSIAPIGEEDI